MVIRLLALAAVAVLLAGCGTSSLNETAALGSGSLTPTATVEQPAPQDDARNVAASTDRGAAKNELRQIASRAAAATRVGSTGYKIGRADVLQISVFKVPELSKSIVVSEAGTINYPLVGETDAAGKTARELERHLKTELGRNYLQNPQVSVQVSQYNSQRVTIEGAVKKPGLYPLTGGLTLMQLVATAGGLDDTAEDDVVVLRMKNGKRKAARFSFAALRDGSGEDPRLQNGDVVVANTSGAKVAFNNLIKVIPLANFALGF